MWISLIKPEHFPALEMAKRHGDGIGRIVRLGYIFELEYAFDHLLDLVLVSPAITCDGLLYLERGVLIYGNF